MPSYNLLFDHTAADSNPIEFTTAITNPVLVLQCENLTQTNKPWVRAGWVQAVSSTAIGNVRGQAQRVNFGLQYFSLAVLETPYQLRFIPKEWVNAWRVKVWEAHGVGVDLAPIALQGPAIIVPGSTVDGGIL